MPTNAKPPLDLAASNWAKRIDSLVSDGGIKPKVIRQKVIPIMEKDLKGVAHGSQAMSEQGALLGVQSSLAGRPILAPEEKDTWSPDDVLGDITRDIGDLTWRGIPALAKFAWNLPEHVKTSAEVMSKGSGKADTKWLREHGYEPNAPITSITDPSAWASAVRNLAKVPVFGIVPGVHTAAGLTTPEGRVDLAHRPLMTALDILPYAQAAAKVGGLAGRAGVVPGSAKEAALQAKPVKALYRTLPKEFRGKVGEKALAGARKIGMDPESFGLSRGLDIENRRARGELLNKVQDHPILDKVAKLSDQDRLLLNKATQYPDQLPEVPAHIADLIPEVQAFNEMLFDFANEAGPDPQLVKISRESTITEPDKPFRMPDDAPLTDASGKPNAQLGVDTRTGMAPDQRLPDPADLAAEGQLLTEHRQTREPKFTRAEEGGAGSPVDRRTPEARRLAEERRKQIIDDFAEENRIEDRRKTPQQRQTERRSKARLRDDAAKKLEAKAEIARAGGKDELAAALKDSAEATRKGYRDAPIDDPNLGLGPEGTALSPEDFAKWDAEMEAMSVASGRTKGSAKVTREYVYPADSTVAKAHKRMRLAEDKTETVMRDADVRTRGETALELQRRMKIAQSKERGVAIAKKRLDSATREVGEAQAKTEVHGKMTKRLHNALVRHEKALANYQARQGIASEAMERVRNPTNRNIEAQAKKVARQRTKAEEAAATFEDEFRKNPPANLVPMLERIIKNKAISRIEMQPWAIDAEGKPIAGGPDGLTAGFVDDAVRQIERSDTFQMMTPDEYNALRRDVMRSWQDLADQGYHPVWSHNVDVTRSGFPPSVRPLPTKNIRPSQVREVVGDLTPKVEDIAVSMNHAAAEYIRVAATKKYMETYLVPRTAKWGEIRDFLHGEVNLMKAKGTIPRGVDEAGALQIALNKHFVEWHPDALFETQRPRLTGTATVGETKTYLPRNLAKITEDLIAPGSQNGFVRGAAATSKLYKTSIMAFSLKHMAHILFGGTAFLALRGGAGEVFNLPKALKMVREGEMPLEIGRHADIWDSPDQMFQFAAGSKMGKLYEQSLGRFANAKQRFDEFAINVQRADAFLSESQRATRRGATPAEAHAQGVEHVYKTLVDIEGMNPMERNVLRQVMPFYAFMRHTLKYILTYPIDHPMRAAILGRIADIEQADWDSGLPEAMQTMFFMGNPDADGNITGIEMRQFNPFRDTGSYFTLAGFMKAIHPAAQIPLTIAGMDKFTGSAELYPELEYDELTGNLKAKRPPNAPWAAATTIIPELGLVDYFGGITQEMRELKARNPEAYKRRLYAMLFVPFEPKEINKAVEVSDMQQARLQIAQQAVSNAAGGGGTEGLQRYQAVPYQGELVPPETLTNVIDLIKRIRPEVAPRSALPPVELSRL